MKGWCQHKGSDAIVFPVCSSLCNYAAKSPMCGFCNDHKTILSTQSDGQYIGYDATHIKKCVCNGVVDEVLSRDAFTNLQVSVKVNSQVYGICTNRGILDQDGHMETCKPTRVGIAYNYSSEKGSVEFPRHLDFDTFRNHIKYNNRKKNKKPVFLDSTMIEVVNGRNKGRWDRWLFHPARCYPKQVRFVEKKGKKKEKIVKKRKLLIQDVGCSDDDDNNVFITKVENGGQKRPKLDDGVIVIIDDDDNMPDFYEDLEHNKIVYL